MSTTTFTLLHWSQIHFFFHKKITHPLISKTIRHNDKTFTLIFKVLKVQKLMIYLVVILKERKRRQLMLML